MAVTAQYLAQTRVTETITLSVPDAASSKVLHDDWDFSHNLSGSTSTPVTKVVAAQVALSGGAATIDLTSLTGANGVAVDGTGLKVQLLKLRNPSTNGNDITIAVGASNGYEFRGAAWSETLSPGDETLFFSADNAPDIGAAAKTLDLSGTLTQALDVQIVMG